MLGVEIDFCFTLNLDPGTAALEKDLAQYVLGLRVGGFSKDRNGLEEQGWFTSPAYIHQEQKGHYQQCRASVPRVQEYVFSPISVV